jgi:Toprim domain-containing protein/uncharacterized protein DUF3991
MDEELDLFKQSDMREYAASVGYVVDRRESSRNSTVMRRDHDKIIISRKPDGHYTYWSPRDDGDRGTIVDFVQRRKGLPLGGVRKELRAWFRAPVPARPALPQLARMAKDVGTVRRRFAAMAVVPRHPYLEEERGIRPELLLDPRFAGRIRIDRHGAAAFAHYDVHGKLCGYELKNRGGFTGFAPGGVKGLFLSKASPDDRCLVLTESAIDALSYAALFPATCARYGSIGGKPTTAQHAMIAAVISRMPAGSEIIAAMDADEAGRKLAEGIERVFQECGRADLSFRRVEPTDGKDWNDMLRAARQKHSRPGRPGEPAARGLPSEPPLTS